MDVGDSKNLFTPKIFMWLQITKKYPDDFLITQNGSQWLYITQNWIDSYEINSHKIDQGDS